MFASHCDVIGPRRAFPALLTAALFLFATAVVPQVVAQVSYPGALAPSYTHPTSMAAGDYNADGVVDFAMLNYATNTVSILLANVADGEGDGSFTEGFSFEVGEEPWDIAAGDLDGDGALELVVTEGVANRISIWRPNKPGGSPDGTFWAGGSPGTWQYPVSVEMVDYTGDGNLDIVVANYWSDNVSLFRGDGNGGVGSDGVIDAGTRPIDLGSGDFNGDGENDLTIVNFLSDDVTVYLGQAGVDAMAPGGSFAAGSRPVSVAVARLTGSTDDLAVANYYDNQVSFLLSTVAGQQAGNLFDPAVRPINSTILAGGAPRDLELTDLDLDGRPDLLVALEDLDQVVVMRGFGGANFSGARQYYAGYRPVKITTAQVDGDGYLDIAVTAYWNHGLIVLNGSPTPEGEPSTSFEPNQIDAGSRGPIRDLLVDLNQDGYPEIAALGVGGSSVAVRKGVAPPDYFALQVSPQSSGLNPWALVSGQFSSDNLPDLATVNSSNDLLYVYQTDLISGSLLRSAVRYPVGPEPRDLAVGDFDRDGDDDFMCYGSELGRVELIRMVRQTLISGQSFKAPISYAVAQSDPNGDPDLTYAGGGPDSRTGSSMAMGDVNDDGLADIAVGSPGEGVVRVYFGGAPPSSTPALVLTRSAEDRFGAAVALGDINDDGFDDIIVGAPLNDDTAEDGGIVYVYLGNSDTSPDLGVGGGQAGENFGSVLSSGYDLNGDDIDDWAASSPMYDGTGVNAGRVYLYWGGALDPSPDLIIEGQLGGDSFGFALGISEDFTADGQADLLVGAPGVDSETAEDVGRIQVYAGGSTMGTIPFMFADGASATAALGSSIAGIGDYNADGVGDLAAGSPYYDDESGQDRGRVSIWYGGAVADNIADLVRNGKRPGGRLGTAVAPAGDIRNLGTSDFAVSAPGYLNVSGDVETHQHGLIYVIAGGSAAGDDPITIASGKVPGAQFGAAITGGGDVNGDGFDDWAAGAPTDNSAGTLAGVAFGFKGGQGGIPGTGVMTTGDFNNDGAIDLVAINSVTGTVNLFLNDPNYIFVSTDKPVAEFFVVDGAPSGVAAPDLNGDGYDDLVIIRSGFSDIVIYIGNGDGTFVLNQTLTVGPDVVGFPLTPRRVYVADFIGNGELDLATVLGGWGAVSIREGDGALGFGDYQLYVGAGTASDIAFADLSGDGKLDIAMTDQLYDKVSLMFNRESPSGKQVATDTSGTPPRVAPLLAQNHPNPFNPKTLIRYDLPADSRVSLVVYDLKGRKIATLVDQDQAAGPQQAEWAGRDDSGGEVAAGVYLYRLAVDGEPSGQRKMVLVK